MHNYMNQAKLPKALMTALFLVTAASLSFIANAGQKIEQTYVKTNYRIFAKSVFTVDDATKHEISQEMGTADFVFSNSDFRLKESWAYTQSDLIDGSGTQKGYFLDTHMDGSRDYGTFQGTIKSTSKPDGSWEAIWEGTYQYVGGSGKYKDIKGSGKYKGKASSKDPGGREEGRETIEY